MKTDSSMCRLVLEDGRVFDGQSFGYSKSLSGEVVFNTGMVGYPEALTDPSYKGQILVLTYPLIGNYGVPVRETNGDLDLVFESSEMQISGLITSELSSKCSHWSADRNLPEWLNDEKVPALSGIDTRALTKHLREKGSMLGKILCGTEDVELYDPNNDDLVAQVTVSQPVVYSRGKKRVVVVDCGCKNGIIRNLLERDVSVLNVPYDYDFLGEQFDGVVISNGPGDPKVCSKTIAHVKKAMEKDEPIFGVCLGSQILALAAGAKTYKLKFGHRGQNQPCYEVGTKRCYITSQNHGFAVDEHTLPADWEPWFINANDGTVEGIRHRSRPFKSVQFHPEATPGPTDTNFLFDEFVRML